MLHVTFLSYITTFFNHSLMNLCLFSQMSNLMNQARLKVLKARDDMILVRAVGVCGCVCMMRLCVCLCGRVSVSACLCECVCACVLILYMPLIIWIAPLYFLIPSLPPSASICAVFLGSSKRSPNAVICDR